jgi:hypothetical protein
MLTQSISRREARGRPPEQEISMPAISLIEPVGLWGRLSDPARLGVRSFLIMAAIVAMTFVLLVLLDYAGIHLTPTSDMLTAD